MNLIVAVYIILNICYSQIHTEDNWKKRVRAYRTIERLIPFSLPYLEKGINSQDVDVVVNCDYILGRYYEKTAKQKSQAIPLHPWIDHLPKQYPERHQLINSYIKKARKIVTRTGPSEWEDFRFATYLFFIDLHRNYSTSKKAVALLKEMLRNERKWRIENGSRYQPQIAPDPQPADYNYRKFIKKVN